MRDVFIAGVGQTAVTKDPDSRGRYLGAAAVKAALTDAGIEPERIGALYVGNMLSGILAHQQQLGGLIADYTGLAGIEAVTVEAACASGGAAVRVGYQAVAGGIHDARTRSCTSRSISRPISSRASSRIRSGCSTFLRYATAPLALARRPDPLDLTAVTSSTLRAMRQAGVGHDDIDLFEPHDAYTIMTALTLEAAGFARPGAGLDYADSGRIGLRGELPLATFGGLKARGHPVGASGCYQIVEAFLQLTERAGPNQVPDASVALVQNIGGTGATVVSHLLTREG